MASMPAKSSGKEKNSGGKRKERQKWPKNTSTKSPGGAIFLQILAGRTNAALDGSARVPADRDAVPPAAQACSQNSHRARLPAASSSASRSSHRPGGPGAFWPGGWRVCVPRLVHDATAGPHDYAAHTSAYAPYGQKYPHARLTCPL